MAGALPRWSIVWSALAGGAVALLVAVVAIVFWPGVPMFDTIRQYQQVIGAIPVDDWHPPLMVRIWQLLHPLSPGTAPMFVIQVALYAVGFAVIVAALVRAGRPRSAIAAAVIALSPLLLGWQMIVLKDEQMVGALLVAVGIVAHYRLAERNVSFPVAVLVGILIAYATLNRVNSVFLTVPLAVLLLPTRNRLLPSALLALAGAAGVLALMPLVSHELLGAEKSSIVKTQPLFDLAGIAVRTPPTSRSAFTPAERAQLVARHCAKSFFWDPLTDPEGCAAATGRVMKLSPRQLDLALARAAIAHPLAYAEHRLAHWNSTERWLVAPGLLEAGPPDEAEPNDVGLAGPENAAATAWQDAAAAEVGTPLGWPIVWTTIAVLLVPLAWKRRAEPAGGLALALLASALCLEGSFLVVSISSDMRYHLWPMTAAGLALILLVDRIAWRSRWTTVDAALLAGVIVAGTFTRATLPIAPADYQAMLHAEAG